METLALQKEAPAPLDSSLLDHFGNSFFTDEEASLPNSDYTQVRNNINRKVLLHPSSTQFRRRTLSGVSAGNNNDDDEVIDSDQPSPSDIPSTASCQQYCSSTPLFACGDMDSTIESPALTCTAQSTDLIDSVQAFLKDRVGCTSMSATAATATTSSSSLPTPPTPQDAQKAFNRIASMVTNAYRTNVPPATQYWCENGLSTQSMDDSGLFTSPPCMTPDDKKKTKKKRTHSWSPQSVLETFLSPSK